MKTYLFKVLMVTMVFLALPGCSSIEIKPWVKPYQRAALADDVMKFDLNDSDSTYMIHVYQSREGARGAEGGGGGGCGCN